ncbi:hypothetical protein AB1K56_03360 [Microbacterium sp. BWR-S6Y]|uniref:hypothetical protein n=1 Tax=Microbacterium sp. BWR-S6Y TaxID=3232073 RepID=UPI0035297D09
MMGYSRKHDPRLRQSQAVIKTGPNRGRVTTTYVLAGPQQTAVDRPSAWVRTVGAWRASRAVARRVAAWYRSVGVTPEPQRAAVPVQRPKSEREAVRVRYAAWLLAHGFDQQGYDRSGFSPWGGHRDLTQDAKNLRHPLTGKPWAPTGFLADGVHAKTGTYYDEDDVDAKGFMKPDVEGRRVHVGTGTVFDLSRPPRTWDGDDEAAHWARAVEWRTPEVEAEIAESKRQQAEAEARIDEMVRIERKMERMGLAA